LTPAAPDILARIVSRKREELRAPGIRAPELRQIAESVRPDRRDFAAALRAKRPAIISEIKKASQAEASWSKISVPSNLQDNTSAAARPRSPF